MAFGKLKKKVFARRQKEDADTMKQYAAIVEEALDGDALGDDEKTVARVCVVLEAAGRSWADFEGDVEQLREQLALEAVCADEGGIREALTKARTRKAKLEKDWAAAVNEHTASLRVVEGEIGSAQAGMAAINKSKATLKSDHPGSPIAHAVARAGEAKQATATIESLERELATMDKRLDADRVMVAEAVKKDAAKQGNDPTDRARGTRERIGILSRERDGIARDLDQAKSALAECRKTTVGA